MSFGWLASAFNYYLIAFLLKYFPGNVFINSVVSSISELVACVVAGVIYNKFGAKKSFQITYGITLVGGVGIVIYEVTVDFFSAKLNTDEVVDGWLFPTLVLLAKFGITAAFTIDFLCMLDFFPVLFSSSAWGFCNFFARLLTIFAP